MKVLGLDVSTSNVGVCLIDTDQPQSSRIIEAYGIPMSKIKGLWDKSCELRDHLHDLASYNVVDLIVVEESLQSFRGGKSSAGTIAKLNRFNGIASFIAKSEFSCPLYLANVISTRKSVGCPIDKKSPLGTKEQVLQWVMSRPEMQKFEWPTKIMKGGKDKGIEKRRDICYDIADAFVVAVFGADILKSSDIDATIV